MKRALLTLVLVGGCRAAPPTGLTHVSGTVVLIAPVSGAMVKATLFGTKDTHAVGETRTGADGHFDMDLFASSGIVQLDVQGDGTAITQDPLDSVATPLALTDHLSVLVPNLVLGEARGNVIVSPWSTLMCARAKADLANSTALSTAWAGARHLFVAHFDDSDMLAALPVSPASALTSLDASAIQGLSTTALALVAADLGAKAHVTFTTLDLVRELELDLSDGVFDGQPAGAVPLDAEATRTRLGLALSKFAVSEVNRSGLALDALVPLISAISTDSSPMYPVLPGAIAGDPALFISSPQQGALLGRAVNFTGAAKSASTLTQLVATLDGAPFSAALQRISASEMAWSVTLDLADGAHVLTLTATNGDGATTTQEVDFSVDGTPPALSWSGCTANDDRSRTGIAVTPAGVQTWGAAHNPTICNDFAHLDFTTYRDLVATDSPTLLASVTDATASTATATLLKAGAVVAGPLPVAIANGIAAVPLALFAAALRAAATGDVWELRFTATDALANADSTSAFFSLTLLATPLAFTDATPGVGDVARLESYSLASGAVAQITSVTLPHGGFVATRYQVTNVSDTAVAWHVSVSGDVDLDLHRWRGLIAAQQTAPPAPSGLGFSANTPPAGGDTCNNTVDPLFSQGSIPSNPKVRVVLPGQNANCIYADDFLGSGIDKLTSAAAHVAVFAGADMLVPDAAGNVTVGAGASVMLDIGFVAPAFAPDHDQMCLPNYGKTLPIALSTSATASPYAALSYSQSTFSATGGIAPSLLLYASSGATGDPSMTDTAAGYGDCLGYTCTGNGCRVGPGMGTADNYAFLELKNNNSYWTVWLSRLYLERGLTATGSLTVTESLALPQNTTVAGVSSLPAASVAVSIAMTNSVPIPAHAIRYTSPTF